MPVHKEARTLFPDDLLNETADREGFWFVLVVRARCEKKVSAQLLQQRIAFYLPTIRKEGETPQHKRRFVSHLPLFPGYVFAHADEDGRRVALRVRGVSHAIPVDDQARLGKDLRALHTLLSAGSHDSIRIIAKPQAPQIHAGMVEIVAGPFKGIRGRATRVAGPGDTDVVVEIVILDLCVQWTIPASDLRPAD
jgi:transcription antitermination factor NusG